MLGFFAVIASLLPGVATAEASPDVCRNVPGFTENLTASTSGEWGAASWTPVGGSDGIVTISVNDGYEVDICLKKGPQTFVVGPIGSGVGPNFQVDPPAEAPGSPSDGVSHYGIRINQLPPPPPPPPPPPVEVVEVSPAKVWVGGAPEGATATIALRVMGEGGWVDAAGAVWVFDHEGDLISGSPVEVAEDSQYRFVETAVGSPEGWECQQMLMLAVDIQPAAADTIYNECTELPPPPPPPPPVDLVEVSPAKVWLGGGPEGATATIELQTMGEGGWVDVSGAVWVFDHEGDLISGAPVDLVDGTEYRLVETAVGVPDGYECEETTVAEPAADTIYNGCTSTVGNIDERPTPTTPPTTPTTTPATTPSTTPATTPSTTGPTTTVPAAPTSAAQSGTRVEGTSVLPRTGADSGLLAGLGIASMLAGLGLLRIGRRDEELT